MFIKVTIYTKNECCLCDRAKEIVQKVAVDSSLLIEEVDISMDDKLWQAYHECIPVVALNDRVAFRGKITELWLKRELKELSKLGG